MKAALLKQHFKDPKDIQIPVVDLPVPELKKGECLIQVACSGVNPSDASGALGYFPKAKLPRIPGRDFAGVVVKGDSNYIGKKIWGTGGASGLYSDGSLAEFKVVPETAIAEIPKNFSLLQAGIQTLPFVTAFYCLVERGRLKSGESVLIIGALGQVGRAAMSVCQWKKCKPIALVRDKSIEEAKSLGWEALSSISGNFDLVLNTTGNIYWEAILKSLKKFGRVVTIGAQEGKRDASFNLLDLYRANQEIIGVNTVDVDAIQNGKMLNQMKSAFESEELTPLELESDAVYPLEQAAEAYRQVLTGHTGKRIAIKVASI